MKTNNKEKSKVKTKSHIKSHIKRPVKVPKTMSQALEMALKDDRISVERGFYMSRLDSEPKILVCAIGGIFAETVVKNSFDYYIKNYNRKNMVTSICKKIKGACDILPEEVFNEYDQEGRLTNYYHTFYYNTLPEDKVTWLDFVEYLYEWQYQDINKIIEILKGYDK